ncbi:DUF1015 family protein [Pseudoalteromonas sp. MMG005]|uniref:DUF1015 family protein n=1 Tax=Pseudoalteromonas sp. MMG005 TaxID=2822682 RepID=UPI001B3A46C1|nr:DUF1015 family protein [Pseudoalteromonas sp. MMG005]MBQ4847951.1 DUF1015 family protein [Pseudoalteromonas sp. MMG005]
MAIKPHRDKRFSFYEIDINGYKAVGILALYSHQDAHEGSSSIRLLGHEAVSVSHALALRKSLAQSANTLPPCMLIADIDFSVLDWHSQCTLVKTWFEPSVGGRGKSKHRVYDINNEQLQSRLQNTLLQQQQLLIADGHHRVFAASLPSKHKIDLPIWITSKTQAWVDSFTLQVHLSAPVSVDYIDQHFSQYDITRTVDNATPHYMLQINGQSYPYCLNNDEVGPSTLQIYQSDSLKIQRVIRCAIAALPQVLYCQSSKECHKDSSGLFMHIGIQAPLVSDILNAAQHGEYFPEKSTYFIHKPVSQAVLERITVDCA